MALRRLLLILAMLLAWAGHDSAAGQGPRNVMLSGAVTGADQGTYQEHVFQVPEGVGRLDFEFTHSRERDGTQLEVGLFDPSRFRGASRFSKTRFYIADAHATPSYVPGSPAPRPLPFGRHPWVRNLR